MVYDGKLRLHVFVIRISSFGFPSCLGVSCFELHTHHRLSQNRAQSFRVLQIVEFTKPGVPAARADLLRAMQTGG